MLFSFSLIKAIFSTIFLIIEKKKSGFRLEIIIYFDIEYTLVYFYDIKYTFRSALEFISYILFNFTLKVHILFVILGGN